MMTDAQAREVVRKAFALVCGPDEPHPPAVMAIQAICKGESSYGAGWTGEMKGSRNWGATTGSGNAGRTRAGDSDVEGKKYDTWFGRFATDVDGVAWVVRWFRARPRCWEALDTGNAQLIAETMHDPNVSLAELATDDVKAKWGMSYFSGNAPKELRDLPKSEARTRAMRKIVVGVYADMIAKHSATIAKNTGDELWVTRRGPLGPMPGDAA